ncbi:cytochrome c-type biogenesis protein CcmH [Monaibacterium marinum]|uniref:Cytochrome c-type biogenesis protein n=1 Tax=Pontivivens marinum TaxID=1690039 RepID=A0A2C9CQS4_9RHOB|nr:cytochrome c-type biogenesis protein [Monaibacterium marinum]SOH93567.1 cytochrome c-type biogenesis protein CcmH [Monaibacterium marinum]
MRALLILIVLLWPLSVQAVQPDEMLADPVLESRAQALDHELRCVLCRSESIASSNADWAADARVIVRELLTDGATDDEVKAFFVARYGDFVLMRPTISGVNIALWLAAPILFLIVLLVLAIRSRRRTAPVVAPLTAEEQTALDRLTRD